MSKTIIKYFIHYIYMNEMCIMYTQRTLWKCPFSLNWSISYYLFSATNLFSFVYVI